MRIVVDAMGSDNFPEPDVHGAVLAAQESPQDDIILVGNQTLISSTLQHIQSIPKNIQIVHAEDAIAMADKPAVVGKEKPQSSMHIGLNLVKEGKADAFVTAGNTGAVYAIAMLFSLRRIPNVKRPALTIIFKFNNKPVILLDVGANAESKAEWLAQYAIMGNIYAKYALGLSSPKVGLMSNGEEDSKGTQEIQEASRLIAQLPLNFVGNIEPRDVYNGAVDVVVSDGFTGNIMIKTFESSTRYIVETIRKELRSSWLTSIGALLARPAFRRVREKINPDEVGGAPLLGVNGVVIVGHGSSDKISIKNAIRQARLAFEGNVVGHITQEMQLSAIEEAQ
jgi:glycerol-3-phosphate acyltransferase PlsX